MRGPADMSGWLQKYNSFPGVLAAPWERNWFRLEGTRLFQFRSDKEKQPVGSMDIQVCS